MVQTDKILEFDKIKEMWMELGSGTDPTEGMGIAIAILEELRKSGACLKHTILWYLDIPG